jgi:hypothetical protein
MSNSCGYYPLPNQKLSHLDEAEEAFKYSKVDEEDADVLFVGGRFYAHDWAGRFPSANVKVVEVDPRTSFIQGYAAKLAEQGCSPDEIKRKTLIFQKEEKTMECGEYQQILSGLEDYAQSDWCHRNGVLRNLLENKSGLNQVHPENLERYHSDTKSKIRDIFEFSDEFNVGYPPDSLIKGVHLRIADRIRSMQGRNDRERIEDYIEELHGLLDEGTNPDSASVKSILEENGLDRGEVAKSSEKHLDNFAEYSRKAEADKLDKHAIVYHGDDKVRVANRGIGMFDARICANAENLRPVDDVEVEDIRDYEGEHQAVLTNNVSWYMTEQEYEDALSQATDDQRPVFVSHHYNSGELLEIGTEAEFFGNDAAHQDGVKGDI